MSKPEIIGYKADPRKWSAPQMPTISFDSNGAWVESLSGMRTPIEDIDAFYRYHGWKRVYKPREFHASSAGETGSYRVHCKACAIDFVAVNMLPHDAAKFHAEVNHGSTYASVTTREPFGSTLGLNREHLAPLVTQETGDDLVE